LQGAGHLFSADRHYVSHSLRQSTMLFPCPAPCLFRAEWGEGKTKTSKTRSSTVIRDEHKKTAGLFGAAFFLKFGKNVFGNPERESREIVGKRLKV
ncbi:MAG: hypothetical protein ABFS09_12865, partial [Thermodesulfobacteriota bacterium]